MELTLNELKTQAKILLKSLRVNDFLATKMQKSLDKIAIYTLDDLQLKHCLTLVSHQLGFTNWHHAQTILSAYKKTVEPINMGTFFYPSNCHGFTNKWFADYNLAQQALINTGNKKWLLPYKNQFIVVEEGYISELKVDPQLTLLWKTVSHDMMASYPSTAWDELACVIIRNKPRDY